MRKNQKQFLIIAMYTSYNFVIKLSDVNFYIFNITILLKFLWGLYKFN